MTPTVPGYRVPLGEIHQRAVRVYEDGADGLDRSALPPSYGDGPPQDVVRVNTKVLRALSSVGLMLEAEHRDPKGTPVEDVLTRVPSWRSHQRHRALGWGLGLAGVLGCAVGAVASAVTVWSNASVLSQVLVTGGLVGGIVGASLCLTMATEALGELRNLRRLDEHLPSWEATLAAERLAHLRAEVPVPLPGGPPPGEISDDAATVTVGGVRLPKNDTAPSEAALRHWPLGRA